MIRNATTPLRVLFGTNWHTDERLTNDCACATNSPSTSSQRSPLPLFDQCLTNVGAQEFSVNDEYSILLSTSGSNQPVVMTHSAINLWRSFSLPHSIQQAVSSGIDGVEREDIINVVEALWCGGHLTEFPTINRKRTRVDALEAWFHVTDRCNLRCTYCFLPHDKVDMPESIGRDAVRACLRSAENNGFSLLKIKYAGGEPLLRPRFVGSLHKYATDQGAACGIKVGGVVLTNGTLLSNETIRMLRATDLELTISLDGLDYSHDCQRSYANSDGSASRVKQSIDRTLDAGLTPYLSITITPENAGQLPSLVEWVLDRGVGFSLNFYRENPLSYSHMEVRMQEDVVIAGLLDAYKVIEHRLPKRSLLEGIADRANFASPHEHTCGVGISYLVFDPRGRVSKCQMTMNEHVTTAEDPDPLLTLKNDQRGLKNLPVSTKSECNVCEWRSWCAGGCPLLTLRTTGQYKTSSPYCRIYRAIYPTIVRLEGLRILQYAQCDHVL